MKIVASKTVEFPKLGLVFVEGVPADLPTDKEAAEVVLQSSYITKVEEAKEKK